MNTTPSVENNAAENQSSPQTTNQMEHGILTPEARGFLLKLASRFEHPRQELLARRRTVQREIDAGKFPDFLPETAEIRQRDWKVAGIPQDLLDRRVEITGPVDRKMIINALNSGANVYMADFEDSNTPTWSNNIDSIRESRGKKVPTGIKARHADGAASRLASGRKAFPGGREADLGFTV
jgi:malate synthase